MSTYIEVHFNIIQRHHVIPESIISKYWGYRWTRYSTMSNRSIDGNIFTYP